MHGESQRCYASVLFADIHGFLPLSETMDPEELVCLVNCWFELTEPIIELHGGIIDKYIGDSIMAFFLDIGQNRESSKKAVRAAIEIGRSLYRFNVEKKLTVPIQLHMGINTGMIVSGMVGGVHKREHTVMGDTVNIASRLEDMSKEGQILVGYNTYIETKDDFDYEQSTSLFLKDIEGIPVFELLPVWNKFKRK